MSSTSTENTLPIITFSDKASTPLELSSQQVKVQVTLPIARITSTLTFVNHHSKTLEGELVFPLPRRATVTGYALDVNGVLVDAVPVEKEKAKVVFEQEVRSRGKGVSMVEMVSTQSNSFKTRIYPLHPNQKRTIKVVYTIPVTTDADHSVLLVPFGTPSPKVQTTANVEWLVDPTNGTSNDISLQVFLVHKNGELQRCEKQQAVINTNHFMVTQLDDQKISASVEGLMIKSEQKLKDEQITVEGNYFCARMKVKRPNETKATSVEKVQVLWDASYNRRHQHQKDLNLLRKILASLAPKQVSFIPFSVEPIRQLEKEITTDYESLIGHISENLVYDGATNLSNIETLLDESSNFAIVFTDGIHTIGEEVNPNTRYSIPLYIVSHSSSANHHLLSHVATISGGQYMNCTSNTLSKEQQIIARIGQPTLYFLVADYESDQYDQVYPNEPVIIENDAGTGECFFHLYGIVKEGGGEIAVTFKYGSEIIETKVLSMSHVLRSTVTTDDRDNITALQWVRHKLDSMSVFPQLFNKEMLEIGRQFSIVTPNTSLIVLEELEQYLKYQIVPPETLSSVRKEYMETLTRKELEEQASIKNKIERVLAKWEQRKTWYSTPKSNDQQQQFREYDYEEGYEGECMDEDDDECMEEDECCEDIMAFGSQSFDSLSACAPTASIPRSEMATSSDLFCDDSFGGGETMECLVECKSSCLMESSKERESDKVSAPTSATVNIQKWSSDATYMNHIRTSDNPYKMYLKQRGEYEESPAFFLDVADHWLTSENLSKEEGINILTNILELELDNDQLLRIVAYRLFQACKFELAEQVFEKVKSMRPDEPQSFRDLALVKEKLGKYEEAVELFNKVITGEWDWRFEEIELTAIIELNHVLQHSSSTRQLKPCDERFICKMELDLRISLAWDTNDTDIDLHVHEPNGEHCYYGNRNTRIGGSLSRDFTQGYGPEEYMLRKAIPGEYKVSTKYFANHQQSLTGGTTLLLTFFTNYMRPEEKSETVTVRLQSTVYDLPVCTIKV